MSSVGYYNLKTVTILLLTQIFQSSEGGSPIFVTRSGFELMKEDATSIMFFVTTQNTGKQDAIVGLEMENCCQELTPNESDCESMRLRNGLRYNMHPTEIRNITMFYTNRYLRGRKGNCSLKLRCHQVAGGHFTDRIQIPFDTGSLSPDFLQRLMSWIPYSSNISCSSIDEDPERGCLPVNCLLKYSGFRSFFNRSERRCQATPTCLTLSKFTRETEKRPDSILSPVSNRCKNIKSIKFTEKMRGLHDLKEVGALSYAQYPIRVKCVHGHKSNGSENGCICDTGWTSRAFSPKTFNPQTNVYVKCDQSINGDHYLATNSMKVLILLILILLPVLLCYTCYVWRRFATRQKIKQIESELATPTSSASSVSITTGESNRVAQEPITPISSTAELLEFSNLAEEEQSVIPAPSVVQTETPGSNYKMRKLLRYPDSFQLQPRPVSSPDLSLNSTSVSSTSTTNESSRESVTSQHWSIPDTSEESLVASQMVCVAKSKSVEAFPRRLESCYCGDCSKQKEERQPLVSIKINSMDPNRNTVITVEKFNEDERVVNFRDMHFPGPAPNYIKDIATQRWREEFMAFFREDYEEILNMSNSSTILSNRSTYQAQGEQAGNFIQGRNRTRTGFFNYLKGGPTN